MASEQRGVSKVFLRLTAVVVVGIAASACSTVPGWVDPTTWIGPDVPQQAAQAENEQYPDLSTVPAKPEPASTSDERQQVASALVAARDQTQYSTDALKGGTEAAAPPPPPAPPPQAAQAQESAPPAPAPAADEGGQDTAEAAAPAAPAPAAAPAAAPTDEVATAAEPPVGPSSGEPAVPAVPAGSANVIPGAQPAVMADSALGFQPSNAPPLDASVAQFVPPTVIARYAQTASVGTPVASPAVGDSAVALKAPAGVRSTPAAVGETDVGGPESMSGAVVANLGTLSSDAVQPAVYANAAGMPPAAVVLFPGDATTLNAAGRAAVRGAVQAFRARGSHGYVRVVGHSSSRTGNMSMVRHLEINFRKSQARATAVARELINQGVPADRVLMDAVGDTQPVYYESMPKGEDGNRRAEIFLQG